MKIHSNLFDCLNIVKHGVNVIGFVSEKHQYSFRQQLKEWRTSKELSEGFCYFTVDQKNLTNKDIDILEVTGGSTDYLNSKQLYQWIQYVLENDENYIELINNLRFRIEETFHQIIIPIQNIQIEFDVKDTIIESLIKNIEIILSNDEDRISILDYRKLMIDLWLQLGNSQKEKIILYYFPEGDFLNDDVKKMLDYLNELPATTLCFSTNEKILINTPLEQIHFVKENRTLYPVMELKREIETFMLHENNLTTDNVVKILARRDFCKELWLMDRKWLDFIRSNEY